MKYSKNRSGESPCVGEVRPRKTLIGRTLVTGLLAAVLVLTPTVSMAKDSAAEVSKESGLGAASALTSLIYGPVKLVYAVGGLVIGSFAYAFTAGDTAVAGKVFTRSLRGDYVITPAILTGEESLVFIGRDLPDAETEASTTAVASTTPAYEDTEYDDLGW